MDITVPEFKHRIGLNDRVIRWLAENQSDRLRNQIVDELMECVWNGYAKDPDRTRKLSELIAKVP